MFGDTVVGSTTASQGPRLGFPAVVRTCRGGRTMRLTLKQVPSWVLVIAVGLAAVLGWHAIDRMGLVSWGRLRIEFTQPARRTTSSLMPTSRPSPDSGSEG